MKKRPEGKACPSCRLVNDVHDSRDILYSQFRSSAPISDATMHRVAFKDPETPAEPANPPKTVVLGSHAIRAPRVISYNTLPRSTMQEIDDMDSFGAYGSKIQTLVRHLMWCQMRDQGSKSIVFSAWADSLSIVAHALTANGIKFLRADANRKNFNPAREFANNPTILVLLLHG